MTYSLRSYPEIEADLDAIPEPMHAKIRAGIFRLADNPRPSGVAKLKGYDDVYRIRIGNYRVVYRIQDQKLLVIVAAAATRGRVYRLLKRRLQR